METMNHQYINRTYIKDIKKINNQLRRYFNIIKQRVNYFTKFNKKDIRRLYIGTRGEFKTFYRKNTGLLLEITSGNIEKEKSKIKGSTKSNK